MSCSKVFHSLPLLKLLHNLRHLQMLKQLSKTVQPMNHTVTQCLQVFSDPRCKWNLIPNIHVLLQFHWTFNMTNDAPTRSKYFCNCAINQSFIMPEGSKIKTHIQYTVKVTKNKKEVKYKFTKGRVIKSHIKGHITRSAVTNDITSL